MQTITTIGFDIAPRHLPSLRIRSPGWQESPEALRFRFPVHGRASERARSRLTFGCSRTRTVSLGSRSVDRERSVAGFAR
jgi:hypothetical protein